jgi:hypothetical protein
VPHRLALTFMLVVALLAACNWWLEPAQALEWARAMVTLPLIWIGAILYRQWVLRIMKRRGQIEDVPVRRYFRTAATLFVLAVGAFQIAKLSLGLAFALGLAQDPEILRRLLGVVYGVVAVLTGNALPKILTPLSMLPEGGAPRLQAARHFVGRALILLGVLLVVLFSVAPLQMARDMGSWLGFGFVVTVLLTVVWMNLGPRSREA